MKQEFIRYVLQNIASMLGVSVYILADTFFISVAAGADGITVLNLALPVYGLIFAIGSMIGVGSATRFAIGNAQGQAGVKDYFSHAIFWDAVFSVPFILPGIFAPKWVLEIMGGDSVIAELGEDYMRILLLAAPVFMSNYVFTSFARNDHAPAAAMTGSLAGSLFNIVFDYVFMFPLGMGMTGAALATALSPVVTMVVCWILYRSHSSVANRNEEQGHSAEGLKTRCVKPSFVKPSIRLLFSCCQLGISGFVGEMASAITTVIFNMLLISITGNIGVAAYGIVANLSLVAMAIFNGISQGTQPLLSCSYGLGEQNHVRQLLRWGLAVTIAVEVILVTGTWCFTEQLTAVFNSGGNEILRIYAFDAMRLYFLGYLAAGVNMMLISYFSATDRAKPAFAASMLRGAVAISVCAVVMSFVWGMNGIWLSFLAAELITGAACLWFLFFDKNINRKYQ